MSTSTAVTVSVEKEVDDDIAQEYFDLYMETFGHLAQKAAARQLLQREEWMEEMRDPRVFKYVARDTEGAAVGMATLTNHLETVPWISPQYFAHHYPEHTARNAVYYLGFSLVRQTHRRSRVWQLMIGTLVELLVAERAVCAWDICGWNDDNLAFGANIERMLKRVSDVTVETVDRQTYYAGSFHGPRLIPAPRGASS